VIHPGESQFRTQSQWVVSRSHSAMLLPMLHLGTGSFGAMRDRSMCHGFSFFRGKSTLRIFLSSIPAPFEKRMREPLAKYGGQWQYALDDSMDDDAFKVLLKGAMETAKHNCATTCGDKIRPRNGFGHLSRLATIVTSLFVVVRIWSRKGTWSRWFFER